MTQLPGSESPEELMNRLDQRVMGLKQQNLLMTQEINNAGASIDVSTARVERLVFFLVEHGALTKMQQLVEQEQWELHLRAQLQPLVQQVRQMAQNSGRDVQTASGIVLPGKR